MNTCKLFVFSDFLYFYITGLIFFKNILAYPLLFLCYLTAILLPLCLSPYFYHFCFKRNLKAFIFWPWWTLLWICLQPCFCFLCKLSYHLQVQFCGFFFSIRTSFLFFSFFLFGSPGICWGWGAWCWCLNSGPTSWATPSVLFLR
jgi:hypothetical protein